MTENNTIPVDQHGALDLTTHRKAPINFSKSMNDTIETLDSHCNFGTNSGKFAEDLNRKKDSNMASSSTMLGKRSFPTLNDGSSSYASIDSDNVSQTLSNLSSSTSRQSYSTYDFNLLENRGSSTSNDSSHTLSMNSMNGGFKTYDNFVPTLGNFPYASVNLDNASEISNPSQHSKGPNCLIPHGFKLDDVLNSEDATYGNMLQKLGNFSSSSNSPTCCNSSVLSSSKLLKQSDMNDSFHLPNKNPLFALENLKSQYTCRRKSGNLVESLNKPIYSTNMSSSSTLLGKRSFPTLNDNFSYANLNAYNISNTLDYMNADYVRYPYSKLLQMIENLPRCSNRRNYFNLNGSELLGKRGSMKMNDISHAPIQNPLSALKSFCRSKEINFGIIRPTQEVKQG